MSKHDWKVTSGKRDSAEQAALYAQGRTTSGPIVTDAPPGTSSHEFGLGADFAPTPDKGKTVAFSAEAYAERDELLAKLGLFDKPITISSGRDYPHVQVKDWMQKKDWLKQWVAGVAILGAVVILIGVSK